MGSRAAAARLSELVDFVSIVEPFLTVPRLWVFAWKAVTYEGNGKGTAGR